MPHTTPTFGNRPIDSDTLVIQTPRVSESGALWGVWQNILNPALIQICMAGFFRRRARMPHTTPTPRNRSIDLYDLVNETPEKPKSGAL